MVDNATQPAPLAPPKPQTVKTSTLRANPHNPRMLFDEEPLETLKRSIEKVGILVPITVYRAAGSEKYTILDGQRRWICATRLGLQDVPINEIREPSLVQNIVTMFQIHKLRKDWDLMPTALKLGVLIDELKESGDSELADLTGLDVAVVVRCKKLLSYDERYQETMLEAEPERRLKADLFIEMYPIVNDRSVRSASWYEKNTIIDRLIRKYSENKSGFQSVTDFRKVKSYLTAARKTGDDSVVVQRIGRFLEDDSMVIEDLQVDSARIHSEATALARKVQRLSEEISAVDVDIYAAEEEFWVGLEGLLAKLRAKLVEAERRDV